MLAFSHCVSDSLSRSPDQVRVIIIPRLRLGRADEVLPTLRLYGDGFGILGVLEQTVGKSKVSLLIESAKSKLLIMPPSFPAALLD